MHISAVREIVASVQRRIAQGDYPTEPAQSIETLEDALVSLAQSAESPVPVSREANRKAT